MKSVVSKCHSFSPCNTYHDDIHFSDNHAFSILLKSANVQLHLSSNYYYCSEFFPIFISYFFQCQMFGLSLIIFAMQFLISWVLLWKSRIPWTLVSYSVGNLVLYRPFPNFYNDENCKYASKWSFTDTETLQCMWRHKNMITRI